MKNKIFYLIILVLLIIVCLFIVINNNTDRKIQKINLNEIEMDAEIFNVKDDVELDNNVADYITINNCVTAYLSNSQNNTNIEYISNKIYSYQKNLYLGTYFVYGSLIDKENNTINDYKFVVDLDKKNGTYRINNYGMIYNEYIDYSEDKVKLKNDLFKDLKEYIERNDNNYAEFAVGVRPKGNNAILL